MEAPPPPPGGGGAGGGGAGKGDGDENGVCCCALACWILWRHGDAIPLSLPPPCSVSLALFTNLTQALSGTFLRCQAHGLVLFSNIFPLPLCVRPIRWHADEGSKAWTFSGEQRGRL